MPLAEVLKRHAPNAVAATLLVLTLATPYLLGAAGAYLQVVCAVAAFAMLAGRRVAPVLPGDIAHSLFLGAFGLLAAAYALTASQPHDAIFSLNFAALVLFAPLSRFLADFGSPGNSWRVANLALVGAVVSLLVAIGQVLVTRLFDRAEGWGSDAIWSATAAVVLGFLATLGLRRPQWWRIVYLLGPVSGLGACLLSGSRGPLLAIPPLLVVVLLFSVRRHWAMFLGLLVGATLLVLVLGALWPDALLRPASYLSMARELLSGQPLSDASADVRQAFYRAGLAAFLHSPLIGYGWHAMMQAIVPFLPGDGAALVAPHNHLHSDILDFAVSGGLMGLAAYALILAAPITGAVLAPRDSQYAPRLMGTLILVLGYAASGLTYLLFGYEFLTGLYVCLAAVLVGYLRDAPPVPARRLPGPGRPAALRRRGL